MRALRIPFPVMALTLAAVSLLLGGAIALAQTVEDAEDAAESAQRRAEVAAGLVDAAVAERASIEADLVVSIARINDLAAELSSVSSGLETIEAQIGFADAELSGLQSDLETHAVDAYMTALASPGVTFVNSTSVEEAMVAGQVVEDVVNSGRQRADELVVKREAMEQLQAAYREEKARVSALKAEVDAEVEHLATLYDQADATVGQAVRDATAADAAYRDAMSAVDSAQAREAERRRQQERSPSPPPTSNPGTGSPPTTTAPEPTTTTSQGGGGDDDGGGGNWDFPASVEQWRSLVKAYFPSNRVDEALRIIQCESLGDTNAYNPYSGASGLFQFLPSTWASTAPKAGFDGASAFDAEANIGTAAWLANRYHDLGKGFWAPWSCRRVLG